MPSASIYLTPSEIAEELRAKLDTIYGFINAGELAAVNIALNRSGRARWRIRRKDLDAFLASRAAKPPEPRRTRGRGRNGGNTEVVQFFR